MYDPWNAETGEYDGFSKPRSYSFNEFNHWGQSDTIAHLKGLVDLILKKGKTYYPDSHARAGNVKRKQRDWWCPKNA